MKEKYWAEESNNGSSNNSSKIEVVYNHIYFYSGVNNDSVLKLNKTIYETTRDFFTDFCFDGNNYSCLYLHINSPGGSLFDAFATIDVIKNNKIPINTVIDGRAASAGTLISVVGEKRYINRHAYMLIHQLKYGVWGKYEEIKDEKQNADNLMKMIKSIYKEFTCMPDNKIDEILKHDIYLDAEECIKYGLADEIYKG